MRDVLRAHPQIDGSYGESQFFRFYYDQYGDLASDTNLDRLLDDLFPTQFFRELNLDPKAIRTSLHTGDRTYESVLSMIMSAFIDQSRAERWVDKSPDHLFAVHTILDMFPEAQIVQVIRDARDVACSVLKREGKHGTSERVDRVASLGLSWEQRILTGWEHQCTIGRGAYAIVRFEDLIFKTDRVLEQLSQFLTLKPALTQAMLDRAADSSKSSLASPWTSFDDHGKGILTAPVGRYKSLLSVEELGLIECLARECLETCHYALEGGDIRTADLLVRMVWHPTSLQRYIRNRWKHRVLSRRCKSTKPVSVSDE